MEDDAPIPISGWLRLAGDHRPRGVRLVAADPVDGTALLDVVLEGSDSHAGAPYGDSGSQKMAFSFEVPPNTRGIGVSLCTGTGAKTIFSLSTATVFKVQRGGSAPFSGSLAIRVEPI